MPKRVSKLHRALAALFDANKGKNFTTEEIAAQVYGGPFERWHGDSILRALKAYGTDLGVTVARKGAWGKHGWHYVWGKD